MSSVRDNPFNLTDRQRKILWDTCEVSPKFAVYVATCLWDEDRFLSEFPISPAIKILARDAARAISAQEPTNA